jgi:hypothetical protein
MYAGEVPGLVTFDLKVTVAQPQMMVLSAVMVIFGLAELLLIMIETASLAVMALVSQAVPPLVMLQPIRSPFANPAEEKVELLPPAGAPFFVQ